MGKVYEFLGKEYNLEDVNEQVNEVIISLNDLNENWMSQVRESMKKIESENKDYQREELPAPIVEFQQKHTQFIEAKKAKAILRQKEIVAKGDYAQLLKDIEESVQIAPMLTKELEKMLAILDNPQIPAKVKMAQLELQLDTFLFTESTLKSQKEFNNTYYFDHMYTDESDDEFDID